MALRLVKPREHREHVRGTGPQRDGAFEIGDGAVDVAEVFRGDPRPAREQACAHFVVEQRRLLCDQLRGFRPFALELVQLEGAAERSALAGRDRQDLAV